MRDEDEIQECADAAAAKVNRAVERKANDVNLEYLRGVRDGLDWALGEDSEDYPV